MKSPCACNLNFITNLTVERTNSFKWSFSLKSKPELQCCGQRDDFVSKAQDLGVFILFGDILCVWVQDTHLKASEAVMWDRVYWGAHKHFFYILSVYRGVVGGHSNTLNGTRDLLLMGYSGRAASLSQLSFCAVRSFQKGYGRFFILVTWSIWWALAQLSPLKLDTRVSLVLGPKGLIQWEILVQEALLKAQGISWVWGEREKWTPNPQCVCTCI